MSVRTSPWEEDYIASRTDVDAGPPLLTVIVVAYNSAKIIGETVEQIYRTSDGVDLEVVVVDNASTDDSFTRAKQLVRSGRVIRSHRNLGFGGGVNIGLTAARGQYSLVMNDDVRVLPGTIKTLIEVIENPGVGLAGPRMVNPDGSDSFSIRTHLPGPRDELARLVDLFRDEDVRDRYPDAPQPVEVGLLVCACVIGETSFLRQIGGFNDLFFMYGEDIDLCRRIKASGRRVLTVPNVRAMHDRTVVGERRYDHRAFVTRILDARDIYYRIWLRRPTRILLNLWRAVGPSDQPFRFKYHIRKAIWDGPGLAHGRRLEPLPDLSA